MEILKTIFIIVGAVFSSVFLAIMVVGIYTTIKDRLNLVKRLIRRVDELEDKLRGLSKDHINHEHYTVDTVNSIYLRLEKIEEENKELKISIEFLREADAEVRWKLFGPEIKTDLKTGRQIKSRKRGI